MGKYRATYDHKQLLSVMPTIDENVVGDTIHEEQTGEMLYAIIDAETDAEAHEKARRLETELVTRRTKRNLEENPE